jgi:hypothetical protein
MAMFIVKAEVFDPALSDKAYLPVRLEISVMGMPEEPTFTDLGSKFSVFHYSWLQRIYSEEWDWSETDNASNAAIYNSSIATESLEPVMPVTVINLNTDGGEIGFGEEYFIRITRAKRILRRIEKDEGRTGYECLPHPLYAEEKKSAWYFQHANRMCIECAREHADLTAVDSAELDLHQVPDMCKLYKVLPYRLVALCKQHASIFNEERKGERLFQSNDDEWSG